MQQQLPLPAQILAPTTGYDDWFLNNIDRMAMQTAGYVRNPTKQTLPRLVGYFDDNIQFWSGTQMY